MKNTQSTQQTIDFLHVAEVTLTYVTKVNYMQESRQFDNR
jgi:hypothetical protein